MSQRKIRVMIVDDSSVIRQILKALLEQDGTIEVIAAASDAYEARDMLVANPPDVITLDIEMPKMDGITFLRHYIEKFPIPTIIVSSHTAYSKQMALQGLQAGAVDVVSKPDEALANDINRFSEALLAAVKQAANVGAVKVMNTDTQQVPAEDKSVATVDLSEAQIKSLLPYVVAIGSSTGGVEALGYILPQFPDTCPGIVIVQHMPEDFTASFAERLNRSCRLAVKEAESGDRVKPGTVLIAPGGNRHMELRKLKEGFYVTLLEGEKVSSHCPSVDVLFRSVAKYAKENVLGVLLTGMGRDGASGLKLIQDAGGQTLAQDEKSSVVYGMPKVAVDMGAADQVVDLNKVPSCVEKFVKQLL